MKSRARNKSEGEFLWLISLSDLMILLFVFFVVMFSFTYQKLTTHQLSDLISKIDGSSEPRALDSIQTQLLKWVVDRKLLDNVDIEQKEDALIIQIKDGLLFERGKIDVLEEGGAWLAAVGEILKKVPAPYRIGVEGHTDDSPVRSALHDNWQLSTLRALSVMRALKLPSETLERTVILGYGQMKPIVPNRDEKGQALLENQRLNRRVTIRIF